jgi:pimeloyl-ACP methyl ester carboxylesterase
MTESLPRPYFRTPKRLNQDAPLFIFLPGMDGTGQLLRAQTAGLEKAFDIRCLAIPPDDLTTWEQLTDLVVALIEKEVEQKSQRPVYLCGESFGGCLALKVMLRSPKLFNYLILVNPASSFNHNLLLNWGSHLVHPTLQPLYQFSCAIFLPFLASLGRIERAECHALLEAMQFVSQEAAIWRLSLLREFKLSAAQLQTITQPTLIVASRNDRLLPSVSEAERLVAHLPTAEMYILPDSGHACLLEARVNLYEILQAAPLFKHQPAVKAGA